MKNYKQKILKKEKLEEKVKELKEQNKTIATLNGSFDLLHAGHLKIIFEASSLADVLIVALNSDDSIKKYKSEKRPIIPLEYRLEMMAALEFVDYVTFFDETNPIKILDIIKPDIHVNGVEYEKGCIEEEIIKKNGGTLHFVKLKDNFSTSLIINKIRKL